MIYRQITVKLEFPRRAGPGAATISRIRPSRALGPAVWAAPAPAAGQNTMLSERPSLLLRGELPPSGEGGVGLPGRAVRVVVGGGAVLAMCRSARFRHKAWTRVPNLLRPGHAVLAMCRSARLRHTAWTRGPNLLRSGHAVLAMCRSARLRHTAWTRGPNLVRPGHAVLATCRSARLRHTAWTRVPNLLRPGYAVLTMCRSAGLRGQIRPGAGGGGGAGRGGDGPERSLARSCRQASAAAVAQFAKGSAFTHAQKRSVAQHQ